MCMKVFKPNGDNGRGYVSLFVTYSVTYSLLALPFHESVTVSNRLADEVSNEWHMISQPISYHLNHSGVPTFQCIVIGGRHFWFSWCFVGCWIHTIHTPYISRTYSMYIYTTMWIFSGPPAITKGCPPTTMLQCIFIQASVWWLSRVFAMMSLSHLHSKHQCTILCASL